MKRKLTLVLAIVFIIALFSACGGGGTTTTTPTPTAAGGTQAPSQGGTGGEGGDETPAPGSNEEPSEEPSEEPPVEDANWDYKFAAGNYPTDADGNPTGPYEYAEPFCNTDEVLTFWTVCWQMQAVPEEGYSEMEFPRATRERTGVNIEYVIINSQQRSDNFSLMLASDDLTDIVGQGGFFYSMTGTMRNSVEDGWFVNLMDYKEYFPNYMWQAISHPENKNHYRAMIAYDDLFTSFYAMLKQAKIESNYCIRGDFLDRVGLTNDDIVTFDDLRNALSLIKSEIETVEFPWPLLSAIDMAGNYSFTSYDTLPAVGYVGPAYVVDGVVKFSNIGENDKEFMQMLNGFIGDGLVDPNWTSYAINGDFTDLITTSQVAYVYMSPGEIQGFQDSTNDPNTRWDPVKKPLRYEGQTIHLGGEMNYVTYGSASISQKCSNIPLAISWIDYRYSEPGSFFISWGIEGLTWERGPDGEPTSTEWARSSPYGMSWAWLCMTYMFNSLSDPGMEDGWRKYAYPGGESAKSVHEYWADYSYDGAYEFPSGITSYFTDDEVTENAFYSNDCVTFIQENYLMFAVGDKPFAEWDAYISQLMSLGYDKILENYQNAYDRYQEIENQ